MGPVGELLFMSLGGTMALWLGFLKEFEIQFNCFVEYLIPGTGSTKVYPSWWIQQFISNPIDPECEVIHEL